MTNYNEGVCADCGEHCEMEIRDSMNSNKLSSKAIELVSRRCVNSNWVAKWLANDYEECCQCPYECKVEIRYIKSGYKFTVTEKEYRKELLNEGEQVK